MAVDGHEITNGDNTFLNFLGQLACRCKNQCLACLKIGVNFLEDLERWKVQEESEGSCAHSKLEGDDKMKISVILKTNIDLL